MNIRNPKYNNQGSVDCEIEHPTHGWIPLTADANDPDTKDIYDRVLAGDAGAIAAADPVNLDSIRDEKLIELKRAAEAEANQLVSSYPDFAKITWPDQEREARAWTADDTVATPALSILADARGMTVADLAPRVIAKADAYRAEALRIEGKRQALEDDAWAAYEAGDVDALTAVAWTQEAVAA
jgi:hypothetical protein